MPTNTRNLAALVGDSGAFVVAANGNIAIANTTSTIGAKLQIEDPVAQAAGDPVLVVGDSTGTRDFFAGAFGSADGIFVDGGSYGFAHRRNSSINYGTGIVTLRSRGSAGSELAVSNNDIVHTTLALSYDGADYATSGYTTFIVDETERNLSAGMVPTKFLVAINDGTAGISPLIISPSATPGTAKTTIAGILDVTGTGITLPNAGTQTTGTSSSDVLDWYEEGTFTPYWSDNTGAAPTSITYNYQKGFYQRVGNTVHFWMQMQRTAWDFTNLSGTVRIWGLPFAVASTGNFASTFPSCSVSFSSDSSSSAHVAQQAEIVWGTSSIALIYFNGAPPGTRSGTLNFANIDVGPISSSAVSIYLDGMYTIA